MGGLDVNALANFGFAAIVAGFVLVRLEGAMKDLRDSVRDQTAQLLAAETVTRDATKDLAATMTRLADAVNRSIVGRPTTGPAA